MSDRTCCGFCCRHIEGTCPNYVSKAHESCVKQYESDLAMGFTDEPWYGTDDGDLVDGEAEMMSRYRDEGWQ